MASIPVFLLVLMIISVPSNLINWLVVNCGLGGLCR